MVIASRTPEGVPNHCPLCGHDLRLEPSVPTLDAPCPHCGQLLWFAPVETPDTRKQVTKCALLILEARFGPLNPETHTAIEEAAAKGRLEEMLLKAVKCSSLKEVISAD